MEAALDFLKKPDTAQQGTQSKSLLKRFQDQTLICTQLAFIAQWVRYEWTGAWS